MMNSYLDERTICKTLDGYEAILRDAATCVREAGGLSQISAYACMYGHISTGPGYIVSRKSGNYCDFMNCIDVNLMQQ